MMVRYLPVHRPRRRLSIDALARGSGVHPELLRRFVALGLLRADRDTDGRLWFPPSQLAAVARIERLRCGLSLNYAALGVVIELLDQNPCPRGRAAQATLHRPGTERRWTE